MLTYWVLMLARLFIYNEKFFNNKEQCWDIRLNLVITKLRFRLWDSKLQRSDQRSKDDWTLAVASIISTISFSPVYTDVIQPHHASHTVLTYHSQEYVNINCLLTEAWIQV